MGVFWDQSTEDYIDWVGCVGVVFGGGGGAGGGQVDHHDMPPDAYLPQHGHA